MSFFLEKELTDTFSSAFVLRLLPCVLNADELDKLYKGMTGHFGEEEGEKRFQGFANKAQEMSSISIWFSGKNDKDNFVKIINKLEGGVYKHLLNDPYELHGVEEGRIKLPEEILAKFDKESQIFTEMDASKRDFQLIESFYEKYACKAYSVMELKNSQVIMPEQAMAVDKVAAIALEEAIKNKTKNNFKEN